MGVKTVRMLAAESESERCHRYVTVAGAGGSSGPRPPLGHFLWGDTGAGAGWGVHTDCTLLIHPSTNK